MTTLTPLPDYALLFSDIFTTNVGPMFDTLPTIKHRGGIDLGFRENHLRNYIRSGLELLAITLPTDCPRLQVEKDLPQDENPGRVDYCFVDQLRTGGLSVLATCEVKGPVRASFVNLKRFSRNWSRDFVKDVQKQLTRRRNHDHAKHYIALFMPFTESLIRHSSFPEVLRRTSEAVPGASLVECVAKETTLPNGLPLTVIVLRVEALL
jgi:hypothetical protein